MTSKAVTKEVFIIKRRITLKGQAIKLIREERNELKKKLSLLGMKAHYERQIENEFDPVLSAKIDCVIHLLESGEVCSHGE